MSVDTVITGGTVVTSTDAFDAIVVINDGHIVELCADGSVPDAETVIDASGQLVMPGVVDPHVHIGDHVSIDSYQTATAAAALGGVTTVIDFAWQAYVGEESPWDEEDTLLNGVRRKKTNADEALIDFSLHGGILRESEDLFDEMEDVVNDGVTSFKLYTAYEFGLSNGYIHRVFEAISDLDAVAVLHTEENSVCNTLTEEFKKAGKNAPEDYPQSRPDYAEAMAAENAVRMASEVGNKYYGIHTSCRKSAEVIDEYREDGSQIRAETCTHYTVLDESTHERLGNLPKIAPPLRSPDDRDAMFEYLRDGALDVVSTDHVAQKRESKENRPWWEGPFGSNGLQVSLPVFHEEAVNNRGLSYPFLVQVMSRTPARIFGLSGKGTMNPGTDADLVVFDPSETYTITAEDNASRADYSIYEGKEVTGKVTKTIVRGDVVADDGEIVATPGHGQFVERDRPDWDV